MVITRVRGGAQDECNSNDNLRVQKDLTGFYPIVLMCVTLRNKWSPKDNHVMASLVSILLTRVLGDDKFHLLRCIKRPKGKAYIWNLGVNENLSYLTLKLVWTTIWRSLFKIYQLALYLSQSLKVVALSNVAIHYELLGYWICVVFEIFICN